MGTVSGASWPLHRIARVGPFEHAGALYALARNANSDLRLYSSSDGGQTWGVAVDAGGSVTNFSGVLVGDQLYVATGFSGSSDVIALVVYDLTLATYSVIQSSVATNGASGSIEPVFVERRNDGSFVIAYQSVPEMIMGTDYRRFTVVPVAANGTVGTPQVVGSGQAQYYLHSMGLGTSDRVHLFYTRSDATTSIAHIAFTSADALGSESLFPGDGTEAHPCGMPVLDGSELIAPYVKSADLYVARATSADSPSWTHQQVSDDQVLNANPGVIAVDAGTVHAFFVDGSSDDIYHDDDGGNGTWGTDELFQAATAQDISAGLVTGAIGVLYNDNGAVTYEEYSLGPPPNEPPAIVLRGFGA